MLVGPLKVTCDILSARFSLYQTQGFQTKSKGFWIHFDSQR